MPEIKGASNASLHQAKDAKNDEFYTQLEDIANEFKHYKDHFKDKVIYCNCDDPRESKFFHYFSYSFEHLNLSKLVAACYKSQDRDLFSKHDSEKAIYLEYDGDKNDNRVPDPDEIGIRHFKEDGDFRNDECIELLKQADIVATNPPFSLFREYVAQLIKYDKKFIIIGSLNSLTYKEIFKLIQEDKLWLGYGFNGGNAYFKTPYFKDFAKGVYDEKTGLVKFRNVAWFTNLDIKKRHQDLILHKKYYQDKTLYPKYDNYDAINVDKVNDIPVDYEGAMGVPITFLDKYNPEQFEILGMDDHRLQYPNWRGRGPDLQGKPIYRRIIIKHKKI